MAGAYTRVFETFSWWRFADYIPLYHNLLVTLTSRFSLPLQLWMICGQNLFLRVYDQDWLIALLNNQANLTAQFIFWQVAKIMSWAVNISPCNDWASTNEDILRFFRMYLCQQNYRLQVFVVTKLKGFSPTLIFLDAQFCCGCINHEMKSREFCSKDTTHLVCYLFLDLLWCHENSFKLINSFFLFVFFVAFHKDSVWYMLDLRVMITRIADDLPFNLVFSFVIF